MASLGNAAREERLRKEAKIAATFKSKQYYEKVRMKSQIAGLESDTNKLRTMTLTHSWHVQRARTPPLDPQPNAFANLAQGIAAGQTDLMCPAYHPSGRRVTSVGRPSIELPRRADHDYLHSTLKPILSQQNYDLRPKHNYVSQPILRLSSGHQEQCCKQEEPFWDTNERIANDKASHQKREAKAELSKLLEWKLLTGHRP